MKKLYILFFLPLITINNSYSNPSFEREASTTMTDGKGNLTGSAAANIFTSSFTGCNDGWSSAGPCTTKSGVYFKREAPIPFLGVELKDNKEVNGVEITKILEKSPADEYNLKTKDIIINLGGININSTEDFKRVLDTIAVGIMWKTNYTILRNGVYLQGQLSIVDRDYFIEKTLLGSKEYDTL